MSFQSLATLLQAAKPVTTAITALAAILACM
jgi:hypothetical protein